MPDTRTHRGPHSEDARLFAPSECQNLRAAVVDLSWLLERGYSTRSALQLVGNRHQLAARQRLAVERCACASSAARLRQMRRVDADRLAGIKLWIDGYNVLLTTEVALGGGIVLGAADGTYRDIASVHGTYRTVDETLPALERLGREFRRVGSSGWTWWLDRPVSNSGRLKTIIEELAQREGWNWNVELVNNPDKTLRDSAEVIATADSHVLDGTARWYNLARAVVEQLEPPARVVDLAAADAPGPRCVSSNTQVRLNPNLRCESCGATGAYEWDGAALCLQCYTERGSCCAERQED